MIPEESRFESDPCAVLDDDRPTAGPALPEGWRLDVPDVASADDVTALTRLLRDHERHGRGWASASAADVEVEIAGLRTRENLVVRDAEDLPRAWGSVHDRASGRMLLVHVVDRSLPGPLADLCSDLLLAWADGQARTVGAARGLAAQQIDTGTFDDDPRQDAWLERAGFVRARRWAQMSRPVLASETELVPDPSGWCVDGLRLRLVRTGADGLPDHDDLRAVHDVLEEAFRDHYNGREESFAEFVHRLQEDPGHRWDHWWLAEMVDDAADGDAPLPVGALVGSASAGSTSTYVAYVGVRAAARGRGVARGLLTTVVADAAARGRESVALEVDADSTTGADALYRSLGWRTSYATWSWHRHVTTAEA